MAFERMEGGRKGGGGKEGAVIEFLPVLCHLCFFRGNGGLETSKTTNPHPHQSGFSDPLSPSLSPFHSLPWTHHVARATFIALN